MNIRTILFAGSLCLLTLSPLQATTPANNAIATVETKVDQKIEPLDSVELPKKAATESSKDAASEKAVQSDMDRNVTMSVGTIVIILLLVIILL